MDTPSDPCNTGLEGKPHPSLGFWDCGFLRATFLNLKRGFIFRAQFDLTGELRVTTASVRDYGAVGDGVTDDTDPIQRAFDSLMPDRQITDSGRSSHLPNRKPDMIEPADR
jgi:hypothetical protein